MRTQRQQHEQTLIKNVCQGLYCEKIEGGYTPLQAQRYCLREDVIRSNTGKDTQAQIDWMNAARKLRACCKAIDMRDAFDELSKMESK